MVSGCAKIPLNPPFSKGEEKERGADAPLRRPKLFRLDNGGIILIKEYIIKFK
jgi:hypothetical protein